MVIETDHDAENLENNEELLHLIEEAFKKEWREVDDAGQLGYADLALAYVQGIQDALTTLVVTPTKGKPGFLTITHFIEMPGLEGDHLAVAETDFLELGDRGINKDEDDYVDGLILDWLGGYQFQRTKGETE